MDYIQVKNNVFLINTKNTSYIFRVNKYKHLEHIHYGDRVLIGDADALSFKKTIPHGTTVNYDKNNNIYTLDSLPQEYSSYGTGDFNEASIEIGKEGSYTCDFRFASFEIKKGSKKIKTLPSSYGASQTLIVRLKDSVNGLSLDLYYSVYPNEDTISRRAVLKNSGTSEVVLHKMMSYCIDFIENDLSLLALYGAWDKEAHVSETDINRGTLTLGSRVGFSSAKNNPAFIIKKKGTREDSGRAWGFNLVYSGNHYSSVSKNEYGLHRIQSGISFERFHKRLLPNEVFETPEAVMTFSDCGLNKLSQNFHKFINNHIVRSDWKNKERPVLINSWEGFGFDIDKSKLLALAKTAASLGIELFVLDDGWFGRRNSDKAGLGDYDCNLSKIPGGLSSLSAQIHKLGMKFGVWVEPEAISIDSNLYAQHPEFALMEKGRPLFLGRNELLMDLSNPEVKDYIVENVSKLIDENHVDYIKWDMNRMMNGVSGEYNHDYIKGLYEVLDRIFTPRPWVLLESCASGGNRFDLGMLCYSPQIWASDNTDPIDRIDIQKGLSYFYPLSCIGAHVSAVPHSQSIRITPLETRFNVSAYGCLGYELDLNKLSSQERSSIKKQIAFYKKYRKTFQYGDFYRIDDENNYDAFEVSGPDIIYTKFRKSLGSVPEFDKVYVKNIYNDKVYQLSERSSLRKYVSSGAALKEGLCLDPLYLGTGINKRVRCPLDYGSDMFIIKKK